MTSEIKQRIEQINNGQVPTGYKETEFGIFPCDWVTDKTFGDLFSFNGGLSKSREELSENGIEYLHYGDMHRSDFNIASLEQYSKLPKYDTKIKGDESFLMQDGDVAFLDASEDLEGTSRSVLIDNPENKPFIAGLHIIYGKPRGKELSKYYKQYLTRPEYIKKQFKKLASGFKVYGLNRNTITGIKCAYPKSTAEQEKIAEILMKWDKAIELYNQQIEKLTLLKSSCIKKMFPQKGEKVPEWRFKGFSNAWEQRKFGEVFDCTVPNNTLSRVELSYDEGTVLNVHYGDVLIKYGSVLDVQKDDIPRIPHRCIEDFNGALLQDGDVIIADTAEDETTGKACEIGNLQGSAIVSGLHTMVCRPRNRMALGYLGYYLNSNAYHHQLLPLMQGIKVLSLSRSNIQKTTVSYPSAMKEQQLIASYFSQLDHLITLHQRKVEIIIKQRKALQQYLLNGIVRV